MRIAIEAQRIFRKDKHVMDFVFLESLKELQKRKDGNEYYVFVAPGEDWCLEESENLHIIELRCPTYPLWEQIALPQAVRKLKADLLHCTSNTAPLWCPGPLVLTLHDIIYLEPRQHRSPSFYQEMGWHYRRMVVPRILKKCKKIITVSHFECNRIREALHLPEQQITAVYNGYNKHFIPRTPHSNIIKKYIPQEDVQDLPSIILSTVATLNDIQPLVNRLIQITMDGKISDDEIPDFALISTKLDEISTASDVLRLWIEKTIQVNKLNGTLFYEEVDKLKK